MRAIRDFPTGARGDHNKVGPDRRFPGQAWYTDQQYNLPAQHALTHLPEMRVAVIGAGACGLTAIKCCLDEGLTPVCFERSDHIGGLWQYRDGPVDWRACVMKSTVINTCKELVCFSDFPVPAHFAPTMHNSQVLQLL
ncbi:dimethylaniline monooxygenase [N-oxide-forming] [Elysia marginata]|uniref:Flavin-containing monooxygenase n=1 Tax=Elysia marginata TaxID=1093978 RepID=A0AAV4FXW2_9GAST|nr:dimethylaniline monooxygenase [N-oxide-forming] [Elysia marginata]